MAKEENQCRTLIKAIVGEKTALVEDPASGSQIYNKGYFGSPQSGGSVTLDPLEAVYLMESGKVRLTRGGRDMSKPEAMSWGMGAMDGFEIKYLVFREMRQRGYVVKSHSPISFRVFPRGGVPGKNPSKYWLEAWSERKPVQLSQLRSMCASAKSVAKKLVVGVVDEEGDVTYYAISDRDPAGDASQGLGQQEEGSKGSTKAGERFQGVKLEDRVMVFDEKDACAVNMGGRHGQMVGRNLQLSLLEAVHLVNNQVLHVEDALTGKDVPGEELKKIGEELQTAFAPRLAVFEDLIQRGLVPRTGFKYGAHFRAYDGEPGRQHARFLVHVVPKDYTTTWPEMSRAVRLAHGVKKEFLLAVPESTGVAGDESREQGVAYTRIRRLTP
ncbi:MAG: tRNA-intron lyase [Candidatus Thermoplasmatota archaeon]|nr:tRNA-intron lyase [Candidatus Thermoplasmatota archaeon]